MGVASGGDFVNTLVAKTVAHFAFA